MNEDITIALLRQRASTLDTHLTATEQRLEWAEAMADKALWAQGKAEAQVLKLTADLGAVEAELRLLLALLEEVRLFIAADESARARGLRRKIDALRGEDNG